LGKHLAAATRDDEFRFISPRPFDDSITGDLDFHQPPSASKLRFVHAKTNIITRRWWSAGLPRYLRREKIELFHGTNYQIPLFGSCPAIVTIHDLSLLLYPATHNKRAVYRSRIFLSRVVRRARIIITPTESVRSEVIEHLKVAPEKIVAIPEAARDCFRALPADSTLEVRRRLKIKDDFLLCVATLEPRKNLERLLSAFTDLLRTTDLRPQLVLVGREGWLVADLMRRMNAANLSENLRWAGYISDDDLCALYSSCRLFIYPSLYEGFGLPPLEAMSCGAPVIASRIASIAEVTGQAARLIPSTNTKSLTEAIATLWHDAAARHQLSVCGLERAKEFTWKRTAELTNEVYRRVIREPRDN
jgi:glycosyltransferase involved in cell wall biosynthesis